ncbi:MAG TPA: hypothetical protein VI895_13240 [Bdellovibrionota bacterium]|nr:hypothetical protein [Bdellovibrionota bacterium]
MGSTISWYTTAGLAMFGNVLKIAVAAEFAPRIWAPNPAILTGFVDSHIC